jgi:hypothetical protein
MVKVSVEVREGADRFEVAVYADSIGQAVGITKERFPGCDVRVMFPIDGEEFFGGHRIEGTGTEASRQLELLPDRIL